jgi:hypothetical protein
MSRMRLQHLPRKLPGSQGGARASQRFFSVDQVIQTGKALVSEPRWRSAHGHVTATEFHDVTKNHVHKRSFPSAMPDATKKADTRSSPQRRRFRSAKVAQKRDLTWNRVPEGSRTSCHHRESTIAMQSQRAVHAGPESLGESDEQSEEGARRSGQTASGKPGQETSQKPPHQSCGPT